MSKLKKTVDENITLGEIYNSLNDQQINLLYFMVGHVIDYGKNYKFDNKTKETAYRYREIYESLDNEQAILFHAILANVRKEYRKKKKHT